MCNMARFKSSGTGLLALLDHMKNSLVYFRYQILSAQTQSNHHPSVEFHKN